MNPRHYTGDGYNEPRELIVTDADENRAMEAMEERACEEIAVCAPAFYDWATEIIDIGDLVRLCAYACRERRDDDALREARDRMVRDYTQWRVEQAQRTSEYDDLLREIVTDEGD